MIKATADAVIQALAGANIGATIDSRSLPVPGGFITVSKLSRCTLTGSWLATGEITLVVPDLGGMHALDALDTIVAAAAEVLAAHGIEVKEITTNQQVTPPTGGKLPAATMTYTLYPEDD